MMRTLPKGREKDGRAFVGVEPARHEERVDGRESAQEGKGKGRCGLEKVFHSARTQIESLSHAHALATDPYTHLPILAAIPHNAEALLLRARTWLHPPPPPPHSVPHHRRLVLGELRQKAL